MNIPYAYKYRVTTIAPGPGCGESIISVWPGVYLARPDLYRVTRIADGTPVTTIRELMEESE